MIKVLLLLCFITLASSIYLKKEEKNEGHEDTSSIELSPEIFTSKTGDWILFEYGRENNVIRRERVYLTQPNNRNIHKFDVVGFLHILKNGKSYVHSYVGNDEMVQIIGFKNVNDTKKLDPIDLAQEFGWKMPTATGGSGEKEEDKN